jgi:hypothetical protein
MFVNIYVSSYVKSIDLVGAMNLAVPTLSPAKDLSPGRAAQKAGLSE